MLKAAASALKYLKFYTLLLNSRFFLALQMVFPVLEIAHCAVRRVLKMTIVHGFPLLNDPRRCAYRHRVGRHILINHSSRTNATAIPNGDTANDHSPCTNINVIANGGAAGMLAV